MTIRPHLFAFLMAITAPGYGVLAKSTAAPTETTTQAASLPASKANIDEAPPSKDTTSKDVHTQDKTKKAITKRPKKRVQRNVLVRRQEAKRQSKKPQQKNTKKRPQGIDYKRKIAIGVLVGSIISLALIYKDNVANFFSNKDTDNGPDKKNVNNDSDHFDEKKLKKVVNDDLPTLQSIQCSIYKDPDNDDSFPTALPQGRCRKTLQQKNSYKMHVLHPSIQNL